MSGGRRVHVRCSRNWSHGGVQPSASLPAIVGRLRLSDMETPIQVQGAESARRTQTIQRAAPAGRQIRGMKFRLITWPPSFNISLLSRLLMLS